MNKLFIPTYLANNIFEVDFHNLKKQGFEYVLIDLDNTLASPYVYKPDEKVINFINNLKQLGFQIFILSNNKEDRVNKFAKPLDVKCFHSLKKPQTKKAKYHIQQENIDVSKAIWFGDQVMTDVCLANKLNIKVVLLNPLTIKDEPITFIPRLLDRHYRKKIHKKNLAKEL